MTHDLYTLVKEAPDMYLDKIQKWLLIAHNVGLSCTALDDNLWDLGITYKLLHKAVAERDEERQQEFHAYAQEHWVAQQLVFVDETSKDEQTIYCHHGCSLQETPANIS